MGEKNFYGFIFFWAFFGKEIGMALCCVKCQNLAAHCVKKCEKFFKKVIIFMTLTSSLYFIKLFCYQALKYIVIKK